MKFNKNHPVQVRVSRNCILVASRTDDFSSRQEIRSWINSTLRNRFPNKKVTVDVVNDNNYISWTQIVG